MSISTNGMKYEIWKEMRKKGIGGSDAAPCLGVSKWKTPYQLFLEKIGEFDDDFSSEAAHWGNLLEDIVAKEFVRQTGKKVRNVNKILMHPEHDFLIANIDRKIVGENAILECKTTSAYNCEEWEDDEIPINYIMQVMHYLNVTGAEKAYFAVLIGGQKFVWKEIERDEELIQMMEKREIEFWTQHVQKKVPPALVGDDDETMKKLYPEGNGNDHEIPLPSMVDGLIEGIIDLKAQIKELTDQQKEKENIIKNLLKENEAGYTNKFKVTWKTVNPKPTFDTKRFKAEHLGLFEEYQKEKKSYRTFKTKGVK